MPTTLGNGSVIFGDNTFLTSANGKTFTTFTANGTYTVPTGVTSVRIYAFGGGGNGANGLWNTVNYGAGGGGGGCAYGDLTVTPSSTITITFTTPFKNVEVSYSGTTHFSANSGRDAVNTSTIGGIGGTASISGTVTKGGAYSGGDGGRATSGTSRAAGGGGGAGSPLGTGGFGEGATLLSAQDPGGGGAANYDNVTASTVKQPTGGAGTSSVFRPEGGGSMGAVTYPNGNISLIPSRSILNSYTDPLLKHLNGLGGIYIPQTSVGSEGSTFTGYHSGGPGGGGAGALITPASYGAKAGSGGDFGGGGGCWATAGPGVQSRGGDGGLGGGGGGAFTPSTDTTTTKAYGGNGGYGGGGGGAVCNSALNLAVAGKGGPAIVIIYA